MPMTKAAPEGSPSAAAGLLKRTAKIPLVGEYPGPIHAGGPGGPAPTVFIALSGAETKSNHTPRATSPLGFRAGAFQSLIGVARSRGWFQARRTE